MRLSDSLLLVLLPVLASAQDGKIGSPILGFAFDSARGAVRPLRGIPGAALADAPLELGFPSASAAISPSRDYLLAVSSADSELRMVRLNSGTPVVAALPDSMVPNRIIFSPSGRSALLYRDNGSSRILSGLPDRPQAGDIDLGFLAKSPGAIAISDDGSMVAASAGRGPADPVWLRVSGADPLQLPLSASAAIAFRPDSHDMVVVSGTDVQLVRNPGADAEYRQISSGDFEPGDAPVVRLAQDGERAFLANEQGRLTVIDARAGTSSSIDCACRPEAIEPLSLKNVFQVTSLSSSSPLMLFDASRAEARVWFVPVRQERNGQ
jgi:hypothetical protein